MTIGGCLCSSWKIRSFATDILRGLALLECFCKSSLACSFCKCLLLFRSGRCWYLWCFHFFLCFGSFFGSFLLLLFSVCSLFFSISFDLSCGERLGSCLDGLSLLDIHFFENTLKLLILELFLLFLTKQLDWSFNDLLHFLNDFGFLFFVAIVRVILFLY